MRQKSRIFIVDAQPVFCLGLGQAIRQENHVMQQRGVHKETLVNTRFLAYHISLAFVGMSPFSTTNPVL